MARNFPNWITSFQELYQGVSAPECYKLWSTVSALAGAVERKVWWQNAHSFWYPNLYVFLVGRPNTRKSTFGEKAMDMLRELPDFTPGPDKMTEAGLVDYMMEVGKRRTFTYHGEAYRNASIFSFGSEAKLMFTEMGRGNSITTFLTHMYNAGDRFWSKKPGYMKFTRGHKGEEIYNPCINLLCCSTPAWLMGSVLSKEDIQGGFGSRLIYAVYGNESIPGHVAPRPSLEHQIMYDKVLSDLKHIATLVGPMTATPAFDKAFTHYDNLHEKTQKGLFFADRMLHDCLIRKANCNMVKVAMLLSVAESDSLVLEERHAHQAWAMLTDLEKTMPIAFGDHGTSDETRPVQAVSAYLRHMGIQEFTFQELCVTFKKEFNSRTIRQIVGDLMSQGEIRVAAPQHGDLVRRYRVTATAPDPDAS